MALKIFNQMFAKLCTFVAEIQVRCARTQVTGHVDSPKAPSASTSMPTSASPLELRVNLGKEFACLSHVTLAFEFGFPMMPWLDAA